MNTTYCVRLPWEDFKFSANLIEATAGIYTVDADGGLHPTGYRTADARHILREAARLAIRSCGRDYYAEPGDARDEDVILQDLLNDVYIEVDRSGRTDGK